MESCAAAKSLHHSFLIYTVLLLLTCCYGCQNCIIEILITVAGNIGFIVLKNLWTNLFPEPSTASLTA